MSFPHAPLTALISFVDMAITTAVALPSFNFRPFMLSKCADRHVSNHCSSGTCRGWTPSSPIVVSRERQDQSLVWPDPRIVQMPVEQLRHHHIAPLFVIGINLGRIIVDKTGALLQAVLRAVCSHVRKATLSKRTRRVGGLLTCLCNAAIVAKVGDRFPIHSLTSQALCTLPYPVQLRSPCALLVA
ncbi:hypothetical protein B0H65DRAFT_267129 [Neurospora tetraspora]|uniref:Secreted protein n=1 Tax=Neurospora tetraspora TaxID=94610 RepID=A0AAE0JC97_9PEZI|nr:hypothetical protein B0H65DRAFT_267129 [Neurospora tetraspora]